MYQNKSFIAIIPARAGSKGLPGKNIKPLCNKPLIAWTIEKAKKSKYLDEIMVTTDGQEIQAVSEQYGAHVPFLRPAHLASDTASSFDVVKHTLEFYKEIYHKTFDYIVLLEPTSPLREDNDIDVMIEKLIDHESLFDSIISIGPVNEHPSIIKRIESDILKPFCSDLEQKSRRQDCETAYFPYGVVYIVKIEALLEERAFATKRADFHIVKRYQCYEIDDYYDFLAIENIMKYEWNIE